MQGYGRAFQWTGSGTINVGASQDEVARGL
jgi:hypothetical protein